MYGNLESIYTGDDLRDAAAWLLQNEHELPEDLASFEGDVIE